ncbi:MAG TPA: hypothetical protein DEB40_12940 [Elusimicrobia bacterium]|nr:hypothetical protein [Elusimicrobiota bacterium]HBT62640.1 hypothetical protein [Elusimicrobiota bacterium]
MERRALIVDDEPVICRLLSRILARKCWKSVEAHNGREALAAFAAGRFKLVICDVSLGSGVDGVDLAKMLLELEPGLKIAMLTGSIANAQRARAACLGPVMLKPFDSAEIARLLDAASLGQAQARAGI